MNHDEDVAGQNEGQRQKERRNGLIKSEPVRQRETERARQIDRDRETAIQRRRDSESNTERWRDTERKRL